VSTEHSGCASAEGLAGVAQEIEVLRRQVQPLIALPCRVDELANLVAKVADQFAEHLARAAATAVPSWLMAPADPEITAALLTELAAWMEQVYLRFTDAAASLPDCWLWHPDVVEELLWLQHAWLAAYQGQNASITAAGDWHDRYRPGVVKRIKETHRGCSLERHQSRRGEPPEAQVGAAAPLAAEAAGRIADWWATGRDVPPPEPTDTDTAAAPHLSFRRR
jgi:hypothetical protein